MSSRNNIIIAAAGSGKTTHIVRTVLDTPEIKSIIVTYTQNNEDEIRKRFYKELGYVPAHVTIKTWFTLRVPTKKWTPVG